MAQGEVTYEEAFRRLADLTPEQLKLTLGAWEKYGNSGQQTAVKHWRNGRRPGPGSAKPDTGRLAVDTWHRQLRDWRIEARSKPEAVATVFRDALPDSLPGRALRRLGPYHRELIDANAAHEWGPQGLRGALDQVFFQLHEEIDVLRFRLEVADKRMALLQIIDADASLLGHRSRYCFRLSLDTATVEQTVQVRDELDEVHQAIRQRKQQQLERDLRAISRHQPRKHGRRR